MNYENIKKTITENLEKQLFLLYGNDVYAVQRAAAELEDRLCPGADKNEIQVFQSDPRPDEFRQAVNSVPFFSAENIVLLNDCRLFKTAAGDGDSAAAGEWENILQDVPEFSKVIFLCRDSADKRRKLFKFVQKNGCVIGIDRPDARSAREYFENGLRAGGVHIDAGAARLLAEAFENATDISFGMLDNEISKIMAYKSSGIINESELEEIFSASFSLSVFKFCDALAARQLKAVELLEKLLSGGEQLLQLTGLAVRQFRILAYAKEAAQDGIPAVEIAAQLKIPPFAVNKALRDSRKYDMSELRTAICRMAELDAGLKNGKYNAESAGAFFLQILG